MSRTTAWFTDILCLVLWAFPLWAFGFLEAWMPGLAEGPLGFNGGTELFGTYWQASDNIYLTQKVFLALSVLLLGICAWLGWKKRNTSWAFLIAAASMLVFLIYSIECNVFGGDCQAYNGTLALVIGVTAVCAGIVERIWRLRKQ